MRPPDKNTGSPGPLLSINYMSPGKNRTDEAGRRCAIGWKYDSPRLAVAVFPVKFTAGVIDIGTADSLLRAPPLDER